MAHTVFICHSSKDKLVADAACAALEAQRIPCWIAPRDVLGGTEYMEELDLALQESQIVLLIFSQMANDSPQVRREIERAVSYAKIILPFRIEDTLPTRAMKFALSNTHWLDAITPPMEQRLTELCGTVSRLIQRRAPVQELWKTPTAAAEESAQSAFEAQQTRLKQEEERRAQEALEAEHARMKEIVEREARLKEAEQRALEAKQAWEREAAELREQAEAQRKARETEEAKARKAVAPSPPQKPEAAPDLNGGPPPPPPRPAREPINLDGIWRWLSGLPMKPILGFCIAVLVLWGIAASLDSARSSALDGGASTSSPAPAPSSVPVASPAPAPATSPEPPAKPAPPGPARGPNPSAKFFVSWEEDPECSIGRACGYTSGCDGGPSCNHYVMKHPIRKVDPYCTDLDTAECEYAKGMDDFKGNPW
jgi:TIR domain